MSGTSTSGRPTSVTVSFVIWLIVVLANIIQGIISLVSGGGSSAAAQDVGTAPLIGGAIFAFILAVIELIIVFKMRDGRNWARIVLLVLAILQVIGVGVGAASGGNAFGWIGGIAVIVATILMFVGGANGYFRRR
jgi:peptidoglycan/LPS O-acetylase OafA/YrhL